MVAAPATATAFLQALRAVHVESELPTIRRRLDPGDEAIGVRMRDLFDTARAARDMPLDQVEALFASPLYEARMGALCILDFRAKAPRVTADDRRAYYELYLRHLDRITTWDMVDRSAPSVVGGHLLGRSPAPLMELARAAQPLRRRTAITAPLWFVRHGDDADFRAVFTLAALLARDPDPVVHKAVGIALKHAGGRDPAPWPVSWTSSPGACRGSRCAPRWRSSTRRFARGTCTDAPGAQPAVRSRRRAWRVSPSHSGSTVRRRPRALRNRIGGIRSR